MTKLKKEHIDKIETLLNLEMPSKFVEETIRISANRQPVINTGANIFTFDQETPLLIIHFELENREGVFEPLDLLNVQHVILGFQLLGEDGGIIEHQPYIIDMMGTVAMIMPNQWDFTGTVYCHTFISYLDGRAFDAGLLQMQWTKSWLDKELPQLGQLEISRFTELIMQIHAMAGVAVGELQGQLDEFERQLLLQIGNLQSTMDGLFPVAEDLQRQIDVGGLITGEVFDELRESVEGIATERVEGDLSWITVEESLEGKVTDIKLEGRTFNNLWSDRREDFHNIAGIVTLHENVVSITTTTGQWSNVMLANTLFKPNTDYTFIIDLRLDEGLMFRLRENMNSDIFQGPMLAYWGETGRFVHVLTSGSDITGRNTRTLFQNPTLTAGLTGEVQITIIEGDVRHLIENHTDPRTLVPSSPSMLRVVGENLFDGHLERGGIDTGTGNLIPGNEVRSVNIIPVQGGRNLFGWRSDGGANNVFQYDANGNFLEWTNFGAGALSLRPETRFIRWRTGATTLPPEQLQLTLTYDRRIPATTPHISQSQPIEALIDGQWQTPTLRSIQNGAETLVADTIESDGQGGLVMVQRVGVVDLETIPILQFTHHPNSTNFRFTIQSGFAGPGAFDMVTCNKLPTNLAEWNAPDVIQVQQNNTGNQISSTIPHSSLPANPTVAQTRQYLIENEYEYLTVLATPITYPVRPINLDSFEPVTHVQITSGPVSPNTSFKIATSVGQRLGLLTQRVRKLEYEFRNQLQQLTARILRLEEVDNNEE